LLDDRLQVVVRAVGDVGHAERFVAVRRRPDDELADAGGESLNSARPYEW